MCEFVRIVVWSNLELIVKHFSRQPSISLFQQIPPTRRMVNPTLLKLPYFIFNCVSTLTMNVTSLFSVFIIIFFLVESPHNSLLPLTILFFPPCSFYCCCCCCRFASVFSVSQTQWHISINIVVFVVLLLFLSGRRFSCVVIVVVHFSLMHVGKSPSTFISLSLPLPSLVLLSLRWFPCVAASI